MTLLSTYAAVLPEIVIALGAMALLMYGAFVPETDRNGETAGWLAIVLLGLAAFLVVRLPSEAQSAFDGAFIADGFARFVKLLVLAGSAGALLLALRLLHAASCKRRSGPLSI